MPWSPNEGAALGVQGAQQSYMAQMLEGLREKQEQAKYQAENLVDVDPSHLHPATRAFGTPLPNGQLRFHKSVIPSAMSAGEKALARDQSVQEQTKLAEAIDAMHPPGGAVMPQELRGPYSMLRSGVPAPSDATKAAIDYLAGKKNLTTLKPGEKAFNSATGTPVFENKPEAPADMGGTPTPGYQPPRFTRRSDGTWSMESQPLPPALYAFHDFLTKSGVPFGSTDYNQKMSDYAKLVPVPEGGAAFGGGTAVAGAGAGGAGGGPPGAILSRPSKPETAEVDRVSGTESFIRGANEVANMLEKTLPDTKARLSFAARQVAQGIPFAKAYASLSPEEQAIATKIGDLRLNFEKTKGGVRMAASPQMYERISKILGDPSSATAPASLREAAQTAQADLADYQRTARQSGRRPIGSDVGAPKTAAPPASPANAGVSGGGTIEYVRDASGKLVRKP